MSPSILNQTPEFSLEIVDKKLLLNLTSNLKYVNGIQITTLKMQIPNVEFPVDLSGGVSSFKNRLAKVIEFTIIIDKSIFIEAVKNIILQTGLKIIKEPVISRDGKLWINVSKGNSGALGFVFKVNSVLKRRKVLCNIKLDHYSIHLPPDNNPNNIFDLLCESAKHYSIDYDSSLGLFFDPIHILLLEILPHYGWKVPAYKEGEYSKLNLIDESIVFSFNCDNLNKEEKTTKPLKIDQKENHSKKIADIFRIIYKNEFKHLPLEEGADPVLSGFMKISDYFQITPNIDHLEQAAEIATSNINLNTAWNALALLAYKVKDYNKVYEALIHQNEAARLLGNKQEVCMILENALDIIPDDKTKYGFKLISEIVRLEGESINTLNHQISLLIKTKKIEEACKNLYKLISKTQNNEKFEAQIKLVTLLFDNKSQIGKARKEFKSILDEIITTNELSDNNETCDPNVEDNKTVTDKDNKEVNENKSNKVEPPVKNVLILKDLAFRLNEIENYIKLTQLSLTLDIDISFRLQIVSDLVKLIITTGEKKDPVIKLALDAILPEINKLDYDIAFGFALELFERKLWDVTFSILNSIQYDNDLHLAEILYYKALIVKKENNIDEAEKYLTKCVKIKHNSEKYLQSLESVYLQNNKVDKLKDLYKHMLKVSTSERERKSLKSALTELEVDIENISKAK